jgi:hypothetical protein
MKAIPRARTCSTGSSLPLGEQATRMRAGNKAKLMAEDQSAPYFRDRGYAAEEHFMRFRGACWKLVMRITCQALA